MMCKSASQWPQTKLKDLVSFKTGKLNSNAATPDGPYPFFTCSQETLRTDTYSFDTECVLLAGNNANGIYPLKYYKGKFDVYQRTYVVRSLDEQRLINRYLYYALRPKLSTFQSLSTGAATKFLTLTILNDIKIDVPPLPTQHRIASILSAYDDLIENNTRRIKILEEMARLIYREWFVEFRAPGVRLRKATSEEKKVMGKDVFPAGWEAKRIGDAIETLGGSTPSTKNLDYWDDGDVTWFTPSDLTANKAMFIRDSSKKITRLGLEKSSSRLFPPYSVMMTSRATIGVTAINTTEACTNQGFITCIPNDRLSAYHIYFWIEQNLDQIINVASGATYKEINRTEFRDFLITVPDKATTSRFIEMAGPISKQIETLLAKNSNLRQTRDLLLPRLISGETNVTALSASVSLD